MPRTVLNISFISMCFDLHVDIISVSRIDKIIPNHDPIINQNKMFGKEAVNPLLVTFSKLHFFQVFRFIECLVKVFFH